jgi:hypothetical protein
MTIAGRFDRSDAVAVSRPAQRAADIVAVRDRADADAIDAPAPPDEPPQVIVLSCTFLLCAKSRAARAGGW